MVMHLSSSSEWSGSEIVMLSGSLNTVAASRKDTPCFRKFFLALAESHSNSIIARPHSLLAEESQPAKYGTPGAVVLQ
jgi:hypothetical protein